MFTITIKKEVQIRHCRIDAAPGGTVVLSCYADGIEYIGGYPFNTMDGARQNAESVQLGGVVHWQREGTSWLSDSVLCFQGGERLNAEECEIARKALDRHGCNPVKKGGRR